MIYKEFKSKWVGKRVDYDERYQFQCTDLIRQYLLEVIGIYGDPAQAYGNAIDYWNKPHTNVLKHFEKSASKTPEQGDIIILDLAAPYGHIAIADSATTMLEQNGGNGNGDGLGANAIRLRAIPKTKIIGILKRRNVTFTGDFGGKPTTRDAEGWYNSAVSYRQRLIDEQTAHKATKDAWVKESKDLARQIALDQNDLSALRRETEDLANQLQKSTKNEALLQGEVQDLVVENETLELQTAMLPALEEDIRTLEARIEDLTSDLLNSHNEIIKLGEKLVKGLTGWQMVVEGIKKMFSK